MITQCLLCAKLHEKGVCPEMPRDVVIFIDPRDIAKTFYREESGQLVEIQDPGPLNAAMITNIGSLT